MSKQYPGGIISKTAPVPSGPYANSTAPGVWTLDQQAYWQEQGQWPTQGNVDPSAFIENLFSTYLYTGNASSLTITNGIDLAGKGGLIWFKNRQNGGQAHVLVDTLRGQYGLSSDKTVANEAIQNGTLSFNSNGFAFSGGLYTASGDINGFNNDKYVSWTFRKQPKFFDVVTYTGDGISGKTVAHNLGSVPGCIIVKRTSTSGTNWRVYHRELTALASLQLNVTNASAIGSTIWNDTEPTSTEFTVGDNGGVNSSGDNFVAYLFAHDAGGFGLTGTDNVISCGSFTSNGSGLATVNLGYEPQWVIVKGSSAVTNWQIVDNMRGFVAGAASASSKYLNANSTSAELDTPPYGLTSTGFEYNSAPSTTFIYIAIRRGPMKVPTSGTSVYATDTRNGTAPNPPTFNSGFPVDWALSRDVSQTWDWVVSQRLMGNFGFDGISTVAQSDLGGDWGAFDFMDGFNTLGTVNANYRSWMFRRYPNVFDVVCYTGTGSARTIAHNLTVAPQLMIVKRRSASSFNGWPVYVPTSTAPRTNVCFLNTTAAATDTSYFNLTAPTSTVFSVDDHQDVNASGNTYVAYLFANCPGVSKVGSVTHVEPTTVVCGFIPRFIMIKSTTATGTDDWFVFDSARGLVPGNDPYLRLNSTGAENTPFGAADFVDVTSDGFIMNGFGGGNYIFLAIA
jgi:hypothetical protein